MRPLFDRVRFPRRPLAVEALEPRMLLSAPDANWRLFWSDEFNGTSLDHSKWSIGVPWNGPDGTNRYQDNNNLGYIRDANVVVSNGTLKLIATKEDITGGSGRVFHYGEGAIHTAGSFSTLYGYIEMSAQLPATAATGAGMWPAFWMLGQGWPPEDDIAEWEIGINRFHQGLAYGSGGHAQWSSLESHAPLPTGFHTYGLEWGPGYQIFYMDGHITHRLRGNMVPDQPMYLLLNNAISALRPPNASTVFPNALEVDYVRVYKRTAGPAIANGSFEGGDLGLWTAQHTAAVVAANAFDGAYSLQTTGGGSSAQQTITGLLPNTAYVISAWDKVSGPGNAARVGVKDFGGADTFADTTATDYAPATVAFTTGPSNATATLYALQTLGNGTASFDDFALHRAGVLENGGFETGTLAGWSDGLGVSVVPGRLRQGKFALREDGVSPGTRQTIYGLSPDTTYTVTARARVSSAGDVAVLGVTDFGAADITDSTASVRAAPLSTTFKTGPQSTTATLFCSKPVGPGSAWFDDLRLGSPPPLKLSAPRALTLRAGSAKAIRLTLSGMLPGHPLTWNIAASDPALLPSGSFAVSGSGPHSLLTIAPPAGSSGVATLTVAVADDTARSARQSLTLRVTAPRTRYPTHT